MILGKIVGRLTTQEFTFQITGKVKKFDYVQVLHPLHEEVLCQIVDIKVDEHKRLALCQVLGYRRHGKVHQLKVPLEPSSEVLKAKNKFIKEVIQVEEVENSALIGTLEGKYIPVQIGLNHILTKHIAVLAKTGSGKSYAVGVLIEEILEKKVPILIIDPHGEYSTLKTKSDVKEDFKRLRDLGMKPKGFVVKEYGDPSMGLTPIKLNNTLTQQELVDLFPGRLSSAQMGILYGAMQDSKKIDFNSLLYKLEAEEASAKWNLIHTLQYLKSLDLFSEAYTPYHELIQSGRASILNLRGFSPEVQDMIVYNLSKNLFELRKQGKISPFFLIVEEAHNFCPERSFGEKKSSKILRTIASEGRKFGLGLCIVSQRPARVDKSVLSQCGTQIILKVTNPNDLKAISTSVEGLTSVTEKEIQNMSIGTALLTGVTDLPLFVNIRPRLTKHGGHAVDLLKNIDQQFEVKKEEFEKQELLPIIKPGISVSDYKIMNDLKEVNQKLIPAYQFTCKDSTQEYNLLVDMVDGSLILNTDTFVKKKLPDFGKLSRADIKILQYAFQLKSFGIEQLAKKVGRLMNETEFAKLLENNFLLKEGSKYLLNDEFLFSNLRTAANYSKVEYMSSSVNKILAKLSPDKVRETISKLVPVVDATECFVIKYENGQ